LSSILSQIELQNLQEKSSKTRNTSDPFNLIDHRKETAVQLTKKHKRK